MIRKAYIEDLDGILEVIADAKLLFRSKNSSQWQDLDGYPNRQTFINDIKNDALYVYLDSDIIVGVVCLSTTPEKCYETIFEGSWINNDKYCVIHRIAVRKEFYGKGIAKKLMKTMEEVAFNHGYHSMKVDTMENNQPMNQLLLDCGYYRCGIIYLQRENVIDKKRIAYQKIF